MDLELDTILVHGDREEVGKEEGNKGIASDISMSATYDLNGVAFKDVYNHEIMTYARHSTPTRDKLERLLGKLENGGNAHAVTFSSGLSAAHAAVLYFAPKKIAISGGYYGTHDIIRKLNEAGMEIEVVGIDKVGALGLGDLLWLETPLNATVKVENVQEYVDLAAKRGFRICVDSTFAPPPIQYLFPPNSNSPDIIMHSGTKFFAGHSDALMGVLITKDIETANRLKDIRTTIGSVPGNLETWLVLRSLKTHTLRINKQNQNALFIAVVLNNLVIAPSPTNFTNICSAIKSDLAWLEQNYGYKVNLIDVEPTLERIHAKAKGLSLLKSHVDRVNHPSLILLDQRNKKLNWILHQMPGGLGSMLSLEFKTEKSAASMLAKDATQLWRNATSLGGVESLIDFRGRWDPAAGSTIVRLSAGIENCGDLLIDLLNVIGLKSKL